MKLALCALTLVLGEAMGFAIPRFASVWPEAAFSLALALLAGWGWRVPHLQFPAIFMIGVLLAMRTQDEMQLILDRNAGLYGPRPQVLLPVESPPASPHRSRQGDWRTEFTSHLGPIPLKVSFPAPLGTIPPTLGETWLATGSISLRTNPDKRFAPRSFFVLPPASSVYQASTSTHSPRRFWADLSNELAQRAGAGLDWCPEIATLNRAILLGRRSELSRERRQTFINAGTIHVFAISGLHVMVMAWLLQSLLTRLGLPLKFRGLASIPLIAAYVVLTGQRPSAIRAAIMCGIWLMAPMLSRRANPLCAWSVTALIVYAIAPERIYDLGCALSFAVMLGIVLWMRWSQRLASPFPQKSKIGKFLGGVGISFAAWIAGVPIAAHAFGRFTPGGLIANLGVILCANYMVRLGASALLLSFLCIPLAALLNNAAATFTWAMSQISELVAMLPFSNFEVEPWGLWQCALWYLAWATLLFILGHLLPRRDRLHSKRWW